MAGIDAFGTVLEVDLGGGFFPIANIADITGPGVSVDTDDVTAHDSVGAWEEAVGTIKRSGEVGFELNWVPDEASHADDPAGILGGLDRDAHPWRITWPDDTTTQWTFSAILTGFEPNAPVDGKLSADVTLKPTGPLTFA